MAYVILQRRSGLGSTIPTPADNTRLLLHCENFFDSSNENHVLTTQGNISISNEIKKFNNGSFHFTNGSIFTNKTNSLCLYSFNTYSIDMWIYVSDFSNQSSEGKPNIIGSMNTVDNINDWSFGINDYGQICLFDGVNIISTSSSVYLNTWNHIAFSKHEANIYLFMNGNLETTSILGNGGCGASDSFVVGKYNNVPFKGYLDEVRILSNTEVWTESFTIPHAPYRIT